VLPRWAPGTVAILATAGDAPHAIPVSTAVRISDTRVAFALSRRRLSLARLREDPRCALALLAGGDVAVTVHGVVTVVQDPMEVADRVAALALDGARVQDHGQPRFVIEEGVRWRWTDPEAEARDAEIRAALRAFSAS
jgi:flavin reductase (DIM6/NTAB) family NADH-FMN oxidoreductase RutF